MKIKRREFITMLVGAAAWPLAARAQQAMPVIGFLDAASPGERAWVVAAFRQGLTEGGFIEGRNVAIEFRWADGQYDRLPELAADLVHRNVSVITTPGTSAAGLAAKSATATIPIVFGAPGDPVRLGLVKSLNRPGGNATGINFFTSEVVAKRMQLLRELVPAASRIAVLINPSDPANESTQSDVEPAASGLGILALQAVTIGELDDAFARLVREKADALFVAPGVFFSARRVQLAILAARHNVPAVYSSRAAVEAGGLMSYGADLADAFRQVGVYTARILKGAKPADLPVLQSIKFELVINLSTARALGITIPPTLLARADEVIE
jgi:putative tryptophan/tyrosine transport system substrate-binding protein